MQQGFQRESLQPCNDLVALTPLLGFVFRSCRQGCARAKCPAVLLFAARRFLPAKSRHRQGGADRQTMILFKKPDPSLS